MVKAVRSVRVRPSLPEALAPLADLAANVRWAWHAPTRELFAWADGERWEDVGHNPVLLLGRIPQARLAELADDRAFVARTQELAADLDRYLTGPRWAQSLDGPPPQVAYFSAEFGITEVMAVYSGGLGVLAGDHLKAASDLGLPLVGIGLLYRHGYFRQLLDADGWQRERYPDVTPHDLPLARLERDGEPALVEVQVGDRTVAVQVWVAQIGRVPLLLLDTDVVENHDDDRGITDRLYGGDAEHRLRQEIVLGIGGVRALDLARALGAVTIAPDIFHANEGHAGFLQLERIRQHVDGGMSFDQAVEAARASVLFTTHTPVPAGIDRFDRGLVARYFAGYADAVGVDLGRVLAVGQEPGDPDGAVFNMAVMGLRLSAGANGVSALHGHVSRDMFADLWPGVDAHEVPITSVTNGVHAATWTSEEMAAVYDRVLPPDWSYNPEAWSHTSRITDDQLWRARGRARERMVAQVRRHVRAQSVRRGESPSSLGWVDSLLDPDALTIGFARRFATYKRGTLLLSQPDRLRAMLAAADRPVQFVFSGKAHPADDGGKGLIRQLVHFSTDPAVRSRLVFVEDYDMAIAALLVAGCDVWLNNPRRPHEASGTSGMKSVLNGGLHASVLDGWWDEMYEAPERTAGRDGPVAAVANGFAIGGTTHDPDPHQQDLADSASLFDLFEQHVIPTFYDRSSGPLPRRWLAKVRASLTTLGPKVLATRMVQDYTTSLYVPLAERAVRLTADGAAGALELAAWRGRTAASWGGVAIRAVEVDQRAATIGDHRDVVVDVDLGDLGVEDVAVQLVHGPIDADGTILDPTVVALDPVGEGRFSSSIRLTSGGEHGLAARVVPAHPDLRSWADTGLVVWGS